LVISVDAGIGDVDRSLRQVHLIEQRIEVRHAGLERIRHEEIGGVVERRIDLLAGCKTGLRRRDEVSSLLEREKVRSNST
jgi:hypothetical protein